MTGGALREACERVLAFLSREADPGNGVRYHDHEEGCEFCEAYIDLRAALSREAGEAGEACMAILKCAEPGCEVCGLTKKREWRCVQHTEPAPASATEILADAKDVEAIVKKACRACFDRTRDEYQRMPGFDEYARAVVSALRERR